MALLFLTNGAGNAATSIAHNSGAAVSDWPYVDEENLIAGPRTSWYKGVASTTATEPGYVLSADFAANYLVIARADKLLTKTGMRVRATQRSAVGTWSFIGGLGTDYNPLVANNLIGPRLQDLVMPITPAQLRGFGLSAYNGGSATEAMMFSKLYACASFTFGVEPRFDGVATEMLEPGTELKALRSDIAYRVERRLALVFPAVTAAKLTEFRALPQIFNWPLFVYDTTADIWGWQLEHVIVESYTESLGARERWDVELTLLRLEHTD